MVFVIVTGDRMRVTVVVVFESSWFRPTLISTQKLLLSGYVLYKAVSYTDTRGKKRMSCVIYFALSMVAVMADARHALLGSG